MKKIICAALAATMCMSVGLMAGATSVDDYEYTVGRDSGNVEKYEENNGIADTGIAFPTYDGQEGPRGEAFYGASEIEEDDMVFPQDTETSDLDGWRPPSAGEEVIRDTDMLPGPIVVNDSGNFDLKWTPGYLTTDKQVPYPRNADATTSATETIIEDEDPMTAGTSGLYAADGGIGFGSDYYNNTGLRHTNCNAHKYIVSEEEWQMILDKDDINNDAQTNDMIRVRFYFDELRYEMFEGDTLLHEYNYADADFIDVLKSIVGVVAPSSASIVMPDSEIHFVQANPQLTSEPQDFKVDADVNSYIYYANGHLCLHYNRLLPGEDVGNARFYMNYKYTSENGDSTRNREAIILNPTVETDIELMPMTEYEYNHLDTFNIQYVLSGINMKWTFEFNQRELTSTTGEPRLGSYI